MSETALTVADPMTMMQSAINSGFSAEQLAQVVSIVQTIRADQAREAFARAMTACQQEMPAVLMDAQNTHTRSRYATLESVNVRIKPVYTKHGFSVSFGTADSPLESHVRIVADLRHDQGHAARYQADLPLDGTGSQGGKSSMNAPQATGSTYSYGQRYLLKMIFNLTIGGEDDDANGAGRLDPILTPDQVGVINDLLEECGKLGVVTNVGRFWEWLKVDGLHAVRQSQFTKVVSELNRQRKKVAK